MLCAPDDPEGFVRGRIIVIGNEKGGTGKTTISTNLAALAVAGGYDTLLVDADPGQQSSAKWAARRSEASPEAPPVRCVTLTGRTVRHGLEDLAERYQVVVVDTGAEDSPELRGASTIASTLIIPVQPESLDLWALPTMEGLFQRARDLNPAIRALVAVNRAPHQTVRQVTADVLAYMEENVPHLPRDIVPLVGRAAYGRAAAIGLGVAEMRHRDTKACAEMRALYQRIMP
jgi:chromosome partitioning protein